MNKGSALTVVLLTVMIISSLILTAIYITANGRNISAHYINYSNAYDIAVAGNEYAFLLFKNISDETLTRGEIAELFEDELIEKDFDVISSGYRLKWSVEIETDLIEIFEASTDVKRNGDNFIITTSVIKKVNGQESYPVITQLIIEWPVNSFDYYEPPVLKSKRL